MTAKFSALEDFTAEDIAELEAARAPESSKAFDHEVEIGNFTTRFANCSVKTTLNSIACRNFTLSESGVRLWRR